MNPFTALGLSKAIVTVLGELGYEAPTPIQERTIPLLLGGRDVIGQAQTGTGKTAAFALPLLQRIDPKATSTQALILTPTRELAMQVAEAIHSYSRGIGHIGVLPVYGGAPIGFQIKRLERGAQIVVGTPGRLIDHLERKTLKLDRVTTVVLDEADEMLRMGFIDDVERILSSVPAERQIALFSATMPTPIRRIAQRHLHDPAHVEIEHHKVTAPAIEQRFINLSEGQKLEVVTRMLELEPTEAVLIFRRTKTGAAELAEKLEARGFAAVAMHGDMTQTLRESVIRRLRKGQVEIVVATDVAARGLDVEQIAHVINYDIPNDVEAYVHRIGRTGRAGRTGVATLFITPRERRMMREIERFTGTPIKPIRIPTGEDIAAKRVSKLKETVRKDIEKGDLDLYIQLVEQLIDESGFEITEIAASAVRLANSARPVTVRELPPSESYVERAPARAPAKGRRSAQHDDEPRIRLSINVGKNDGVRPADVVGSIANEAGIPGRDIGPIEIRDDITYVTVPEKHARTVIEKTARARFRGKSMKVQVADDTAVARRPSTTAPRSKSGVRPRRESGRRQPSWTPERPRGRKR